MPQYSPRRLETRPGSKRCDFGSHLFIHRAQPLRPIEPGSCQGYARKLHEIQKQCLDDTEGWPFRRKYVYKV